LLSKIVSRKENKMADIYEYHTFKALGFENMMEIVWNEAKNGWVPCGAAVGEVGPMRELKGYLYLKFKRKKEEK